jgi:hypothetical protein
VWYQAQKRGSSPEESPWIQLANIVGNRSDAVSGTNFNTIFNSTQGIAGSVYNATNYTNVPAGLPTNTSFVVENIDNTLGDIQIMWPFNRGFEHHYKRRSFQGEYSDWALDYNSESLDISQFLTDVPTLQQVTDEGATTTADITANSFTGDGSALTDVPGDGNGIEDGGTVDVPIATQIQGYTWPSSAAFDNRTFYGDFVNGSYRNDRYTKGANGLGYERQVRFDASGDLVGVPHISISDASYSAGYLKGDRLFFDTPTSDWDLVFDVTHPTISSGAGKDYEVFMDARPTVNKSVLTTDTDGATEWNKYLQTYTVVLSSNEDITSTTFAEVSNLSITGIQAGIYQVHYSLIWQDKTSPSLSGGTPDFSYKINTTNESGDGSGWNSAGFTESVKDWDDVTEVNDNNDVGGTVSTNMNDGVVIFTNTGAFKYSHKNEVSGTIEIKKGSYIKLTKLD